MSRLSWIFIVGSILVFANNFQTKTAYAAAAPAAASDLLPAVDSAFIPANLAGSAQSAYATDLLADIGSGADAAVAPEAGVSSRQTRQIFYSYPSYGYNGYNRGYYGGFGYNPYYPRYNNYGGYYPYANPSTYLLYG